MNFIGVFYIFSKEGKQDEALKGKDTQGGKRKAR